MADNTMETTPETTLSANVERGTVDIYKSGAGSDKGRDCSIIQGNKDRHTVSSLHDETKANICAMHDELAGKLARLCLAQAEAASN